MTLGFVAPWFLAGTLAVALPLWLHRLQTESADRERFSSTMLLEPAEKRVHLRRRLRYLALLALRAALLLVLAFAFAQPFAERPPDAGGAADGGTALVVVDTSASMARSGVFAQAVAEARHVVDEATAGVVVQVAAAAGELELPAGPTGDAAVAGRALDTLRPTAQRLDAGRLAHEIERLAATLPQPVTLHLVSDFQASAMPARFAEAIPGGIAELVPHPVGTGDPVNWTVTHLRRTPNGIEVGVHAYGLTDRTADVELRVNDSSLGVRSVTGSGSHAVVFGDVALAPGDNRALVTIEADDDLEADNGYYAVIANDPPPAVPLIAADPAGLASTYVRTALEAAADPSYAVVTLPLAAFDPRVLARYRWAVVTDLAALEPRAAAALHDYVTTGGRVLAFTGDVPAGLERLPLGGQRLAPAVAGLRRDRFLSVGSIDPSHPVLAATQGWHRLNVARSIAVEPSAGDRVLVRLDDGSPYVIEQPVGAGTLLLVLDPLDNRASDLPVHPVFVGFLLEAARHLEGRAQRVTALAAGDRLAPGAGASGGQVVAPDGTTLLALEATARPRPVRLEQPGIYEVHSADGRSLVAVNVDSRESDPAAIDGDTLERLRASTHAVPVARGPGLAAATASPRVEIWPWLLLALALSAMAESLLANFHLAAGQRVAA